MPPKPLRRAGADVVKSDLEALNEIRLYGPSRSGSAILLNPTGSVLWRSTSEPGSIPCLGDDGGIAVLRPGAPDGDGQRAA